MYSYVIHFFGGFDLPSDLFVDKQKHGMEGMRKFFKKDTAKRENYLKTYRKMKKRR